MSNDMTDVERRDAPVADRIALPRAEPATFARDGDPERNIVFGSLVTGDNDIVGLVAYSIYKQNKHDWLIAFERAKARAPNDDELQSYIVGESTARRLATYRHLAQATLDGRGPDVAAAPASEGFSQRGYAIAQRYKAAATSGGAAPGVKAALYVIAAIVVLVAIYLAVRYGASQR